MNWHEYFTYNPETGDLIWKERPLEHFRRDIDWKMWNKRFAKKAAGTSPWNRFKNQPQYLHIGITPAGGVKKIVFAHRIIYEMNHGPVPAGMVVDHINGAVLDNRLKNLRLATTSQNARNCRPRKNTSSGIKGVHWFGKTGKWRVSFKSPSGKSLSFGLYKDLEEAAAVYRREATKHFGEFARFE